MANFVGLPNFNNIIQGTESADTISGNNWNDHLYGNGGNDLIRGGGGNDALDGGAGNDHLIGGDGADHLAGGYGNDFLEGGFSNDVLEGGKGDDRLYGGAARDLLTGGAGDDVFEFHQDAVERYSVVNNLGLDTVTDATIGDVDCYGDAFRGEIFHFEGFGVVAWDDVQNRFENGAGAGVAQVLGVQDGAHFEVTSHVGNVWEGYLTYVPHELLA